MKRYIKTMLALGMCLTFLVSGCAFLKVAEKDIIAEIVAQDVGCLIAKENPELGAAILEYTEWTLETTEGFGFDIWRDYICNLLIDDKFLRVNFEKLVSLIEVDLGGIGDIEECISVMIPVLRSFTEGIRIGLSK